MLTYQEHKSIAIYKIIPDLVKDVINLYGSDINVSHSNINYPSSFQITIFK